MKTIELISLGLRNFAGLVKYSFEPDGKSVSILAQNRTGKTRIANAWTWLLFNKNLQGKTAFDVVSLDENDNPIKGLEVMVEGKLRVDGATRVFKKVQKEDVVEGQVTGYTSVYWIDEVEKSQTQYKKYITDNLLTEKTFRMLTDPQYFNSQLEWQERREILTDLAGEIKKPTGFDFLDKLNDRSIDDYKKVLTDREKLLAKERKGINPRLDEINIALGELGNVETGPAAEQRDNAYAEIKNLDEHKSNLLAGQAEREAQVSAINLLKVQLGKLENELKQGDPAKITPILAEKLEWEKKLADLNTEKVKAKRDADSSKIQLESEKDKLTIKRKSLDLVRREDKELSEVVLDKTCSACQRELPADQLEKLKANRDSAIKNLAKTGRKLHTECKVIGAASANLELVYNGFDNDCQKLAKALTDMEFEKEEAFEVLDEKIKACKKGIKPQDDDEWKRLSKKIDDMESALPGSISEELAILDTEKDVCNKVITDMTAILASPDRITSDKARIKVHKARQKELAQLIADIKKELAEIVKYHKAESDLVEKAVNDMFPEGIKFKLFKELLTLEKDGGEMKPKQVPCCEAILDGVPYRSMSGGEKIYVGCGIIRVLSKFYKALVVMFIDNHESLTGNLVIETDAQVIRLFAKEGVKELTVK